MAQPAGGTTNTSRPPCNFWLRGYCRLAGNCTFRHDSPFTIAAPTRDARAEQPCRYVFGGRCINGLACPYKHPPPVAELTIPELKPSQPALPIPATVMTELFEENRTPHPRASKGVATPHRPGDLLLRVIYSYISVLYGPGLEVFGIVLLSDTVPVKLSTLPSNVTKKDLLKVLREHGDPVSLHIHRPPKRTTTATAMYATRSAAVKAARELDGLYLDTAIITAVPELAVVPLSLHTTTLKIVWDAPTHDAVLGYRTSEFAHRRAVAINGHALDGLRLAAFYCAERQPSVVIPNLPVTLRLKGLQLLAKADSITFTRPSYQIEAARTDLQALLRKYGPLDSFHLLPLQPGNRKVCAIACFTHLEHLEAAVSALHGRYLACVGGSRVRFHRAHSVEYSIPLPVFAVIKKRINDLRTHQPAFTSLRVIERPESRRREVHLHLQAEDPAILSRLKATVESIIDGQLLRDSGGLITWDDDFFLGNATRRFLQHMNGNGKVFVTCNAVQRRVIIFGLPADIADARDSILCRYKAYVDDRVTMVIDENSLGHFAKRGLGASEFAEKRSHEVACTPCPVCRSEVTQSAILPCGHDYCSECLKHYLVSSSSYAARTFPLPCIASIPAPPGLPISRPPTCDAPIPISTIRALLNPDEETALLEASFTAHIFAHSDTYKFCPTPDCNQVYRVTQPGAPSIFTCPSCLESACTACCSAHPGLTCERYCSARIAQSHQADVIKRCPTGCGALIQKQEGCNHLQCIICKAHMCWICLRVFPEGGVYEHIASAHAEGVMPGVVPNMLLP